MSPPHALNGLVPILLRRQLATSGAPVHEPTHRRFPAAMLIADISGFTALAERLAARGPDGVEELSRLVNRWFGAMADAIEAHGGDVIRFAGDAPIAVFPAGDAGNSDLSAAIARAVACGAALRDAMRALATAEADVGVRVGIGAGDVTSAIAGGVDGRWEFVLGGSPLAEMAEAERRAATGEIVLSPAAEAARGGAPAEAAAIAPLAVPPVDDRLVRPFVPDVALQFIDAGQAAWTAELRRLTVLFLGVRGIDLDAPDGASLLHDALARLQAAVFGQGGSINQFLVDDKGLTLVASWGVAGHRHEDDPARAARAALACRTALASMGLAVRGGLATGRVFCGWRGNERRREYALIGAVVNRAARLMTATLDELRGDEATAAAAAADVGFEDAGELTLKGTGLVRTFRPVGDAAGAAPRVAAARDTGAAGMIGRAAERERLAAALDRLARGTSTSIVIRGDAGMGKSTLVSAFVAMARARPVTVAIGTTESASASSAYAPWRGVIGTVLGLDGLAGVDARIAALGAALAARPDRSDFAPLVAEVLGLPLRDTPATARLTGQARLEKTRDLIVGLLQDAASAAPLVIVLDNVHWMDALSVALARAVRRRVSPLLLVLVTRPFGPDASTEVLDLTGSDVDETIDLARLGPDDVRRLMCRRLGVTHVPDELLTLVEARSAGYPLFVGELVSSLLDAGVIRTSGSACLLVDDGARLRSHRFPDSVQGAIADRLDRLPLAEQLTMKVATAIGAPFDAGTVAAVHPMRPDASALDALLATLLARGLIVRQGAGFQFGHAVMQDVAYGMLPSDQRRALHRSIGEWYERAGAGDVPAPVMAHHWTEADVEERSLFWLERAGEDASRLGALREVLRHLGRAFEIAGRPAAAPVDPLRRVRWHRLIGYAQSDLGAIEESTRQLRTALDLVGGRLPASPAAMGVRLGREAIRQAALLSGILPVPARRSTAARARTLEEAEVLRLLGKLAFYAQDHLGYITISLQSINVAERAGARETAASAYAALGYVVAMLGMERLARRWWRLADESGELDARLNMLIGRMMFLNSHARWEESARLAEEQARVIARQGTSTSLPSHLMITGYIHLHHARYEEAEATVRKLLDWCLSVNHLQQAFGAHLQLCAVFLEQGRIDQVRQHLAEADALAGHVSDPMYRSIYRGIAVDTELAAGDLDAARAPAEALREVMAGSSPYFGDMLGFAALTEYYLARRRAAGDGAEGRALIRDARWAHAVLKRHAGMNPYARPRMWLLDGKIAAAEGRPGRARRSWRRALALAERYDMPREIARAREKTPGVISDSGRK